MNRVGIRRAWGALLVRLRLRDPFEQAMISGDVTALRNIWAMVTGQPAPESVQEAELQMHLCRTKSDKLPLNVRCYSHHWLIERGLPSLLPPQLRPKAEAYRPKIVSAVGIAMGTSKGWLKPALPMICHAMAKTVADNAELIEKDPELLRDKIQFARGDEFRRLFGAVNATEVER